MIGACDGLEELGPELIVVNGMDLEELLQLVSSKSAMERVIEIA